MSCAPDREHGCVYPHCDCGYPYAEESAAYEAEEIARAEAHLRPWTEEDEEPAL